ncbi:MAG: hypothetical protein ACI4DY_01735 [Monoglobaceae bacterium]
MKKVRSILCLLVSIFMLPIMAVSVSAEDVTTAEGYYAFSENWKTPTYDSDYTSEGNSAFIEPTSKTAMGSGHSAHFYIQKTGGANQYATLKTNKTFSAGTYTVEFNAKFDHDYYCLYIDNTNKVYYVSNMTRAAVSDGWYKMSVDVELTQASTISLRAFGVIHLYVDDFKVTSGGSVVFEDNFESVKNIIAENDYNISSNWQSPEIDSRYANDNNYAFVEPTDRVSYNGSGHSMHYYVKKTGGANQYVTLKTSKTLPAGTYSMEFYAKYSTDYYNVYIDSTNTQYFVSNMTVTSASDGWYKMNVSITLSSASTVSIRAFGVIQLYVDDVKITDSSSNVVFSDDFENVTEKSREVKNVLASPNPASDGSGSLIVSWANPAGGIVESNEIYVDGVKYEPEVTIDTTAGAFNKVTVTGLTDKQKYTIKLSQKLWEENQNREYETTGMPDACGATCNLNEWLIGRQLQCDFALEKEEGGNTAMKIYANIPSAVALKYASASQKLTLRKNTKYKLSFKAKSKNLYSFMVLSEFTNTDGTKSWNYWGPVGQNVSEWTEYSQNLSTAYRQNSSNAASTDIIYDATAPDSETYEVNVQFLVNSAEGWAALDDVELYALDYYDESQTEGDNLIKNGDFELTYDVLKPEYRLVSGEDESTPITALQQGTVEVTAKIKNYTVDGFSPTIIFALYNDNRLMDTTIYESRNMPITSAVIPADEVTTTFNVPALDGGAYSIKTFYFDGMNTIRPLASQAVITE